MSTHEFLDAYCGPVPDVVFIDADHSYTSVAADYHGVRERWQDALVFLHDTWPTEPGHLGGEWGEAYLLRLQLEHDPAVEVFTWRRFPGLTIVQTKKENHVPT